MNNTTQYDDVFDSSISLEKTHIEEGYTDGYKAGLAVGHRDGYEVGLKHGFGLGEEVGFYRGLVSVWVTAIRVDPDCFPGRVQKAVIQMKELIERYPLMEVEDEGKDEIIERIRVKFKVICATLGLKLEYNGYPRVSDAPDMEF